MERLSSSRRFNMVTRTPFCHVLVLTLLANWSSVPNVSYNGLTVDGSVTNYNYKTTAAGNHTMIYSFWTIIGSSARFTLGSLLSLYSNVIY